MYPFIQKAGVVLTAAALAATMFGCSSTNATSGSSSAASSSSASAQATQDRTITDMKGDQVVIPADATTVETANSVATQMVLMLGGENAAATLGQGFNYADDSLNKEMFPGLGSIQTVTRNDVTVENVAALAPGFVVIDVPDTVTALRDAGIPVAYVSVTSPDTIIQAVDIIGQGLGGDAAAKAEKYDSYYKGVIDEVTNLANSVDKSNMPRVLYLRSTTSTTGTGSMPDNWITASGCIDVSAELGLSGSNTQISAETILSADPDYIVCEKAADVNTIMTDSTYAELKAVKEGHVYAAPLGTAVWSMGTAEAPLMLYWAGTTFNPEAFSSVDMKQKTSEFFSTFYDYDLTEADLNKILG